MPGCPALPHFFSHYTSNTTAVADAVTNAMAMYPLSAHNNSQWVRSVGSDRVAACVASHTHTASSLSTQRRAAAIMRDWFFTCATRRAATAISDNGGDVWLYQFSQKLPWLMYDVLGDYHGSEVVRTQRYLSPLGFHMAPHSRSHVCACLLG